MAPRVIVVGLGPGRPEQLTREAWDTIWGTQVLYLRTRHHPVVGHLPGHLEVRAFEQFGGAGQDRVRPAEAVVAWLLQGPERPLVYAVPGHPLVGEATTRLLLHHLGPEEVHLVAGLSVPGAACTALGLDPLEQGLQLYDALDLALPDSPFLPPVPLDPTRPLLVACLTQAAVAAGLIRSLRQHYPSDHPVAAVSAAGVAGQTVRWSTLVDLEGEDRPDGLCTLYLPALGRLQARREAATLEWVLARLRGPGGCPWDREQDHSSLRRNLLEECFEVLDTLDREDLQELREELGDLLMQVFLHAQLAREEGAFTLGDVLEGITTKLIRRHPHVFGQLQVADSREVLRNWEAIKAVERGEEGEEGTSLLDGLPRALPALAHAQAIGRRVARVGFDWTRVEDVWTKVEEEMGELRRAGTDVERAEELGDVLFSLVNLARWLGVEAEDSLRATNAKFRQRFTRLEQEAGRRGLALERMELAEMDGIWDALKEQEK